MEWATSALVVLDEGVPGDFVETVRREREISEPLVEIDWTGVRWQKAG